MHSRLRVELILGGLGVSSLLLASELASRGAFESLTLIGPRHDPAAHVFSYWSDQPTPFDRFVEFSWNTLQVTDAQGPIPVELSRFTYRTFRAARWARALTDHVLRLPGVTWIDAQINSAESEGVRARVTLENRDVLHADWAFISGQLGVERPARWQHFIGLEVELDEPLLNTETANILDFRTPADDDFRFIYALPFSSTRLFVEHVSHRPCTHQGAIEQWLRAQLGVSSWRVVDREAGATPLFAETPHESGRVRHIGVAGGFARSCTGYALTRMWRDAEEQALSLQRWKHPRGRSRGPFLSRTADSYFLDRLAHAPQELPKLMRALFSGAPGDAVLGFLDDRATLEEKRAVAAAMPGWLRWWASARTERYGSPP